MANEVVAARKITEVGFGTHARKGEKGEIVDVFDNGLVMVRWNRTGTACDCAPSEIRAIDQR